MYDYTPKSDNAVILLLRQEDKDIEHGTSQPDISEKLACMTTDDTSLTDWHLGFHISLVSLRSLAFYVYHVQHLLFCAICSLFYLDGRK